MENRTGDRSRTRGIAVWPNSQERIAWTRVGDGSICLHLITRSLSVEALQAIVQFIPELISSPCDRLIVDCSDVEEFAGPWGAHFAMFLCLAARLRVAIAVRGLRGQPAAVAWLFRHSPQVRGLLAD